MGRRPKEDLRGKAIARMAPQCTKWAEETAWPDRRAAVREHVLPDQVPTVGPGPAA